MLTFNRHRPSVQSAIPLLFLSILVGTPLTPADATEPRGGCGTLVMESAPTIQRGSGAGCVADFGAGWVGLPGNQCAKCSAGSYDSSSGKCVAHEQQCVDETTLEPNTNRSGGDYANFPLPNPDPQSCGAACVAQPTCVAWTYVNPGLQNASSTDSSKPAHCWLKSMVSAATADSCCVSGVKRAGSHSAGVNSDCEASSNGAYSVAQANAFLATADPLLDSCAYVDGAPWKACQDAYAALSDADVNLVQVFQDALPSPGHCWICKPEGLVSAAQTLSFFNIQYTSNSHQAANFDQTLFNIQSQTNLPFCSP